MERVQDAEEAVSEHHPRVLVQLQEKAGTAAVASTARVAVRGIIKNVRARDGGAFVTAAPGGLEEQRVPKLAAHLD